MVNRHNNCLYIFFFKLFFTVSITTRTGVVSKLRSVVYYLHQLPERTKQLLFPFSQRQDNRVLKEMRSVAHPSSRAFLFLQPGLLLPPASSRTSAITFARRSQPRRPGFSRLTGSPASRAIAPKRCPRSRAACSCARRPQLCVKSLFLYNRHPLCWISYLVT